MTFPARLGSLTDELIEVITSTTAQTDPARYDAWKESSLRRLRQHSYLRTNQFEVYSALDGYEERFRVLNRDGIADALRDRLDALAQRSNKWTPDILHLLLMLADQPVQKSSLDDLEALKRLEEAPVPKLKWSDIAKEEGWDGDGELWRNVDFTGYSSDDGYYDDQTDASIQSEDTSLSSVEARFRKQPTDYLESMQSQLDLDEIRKSQGWRQRKSARNPSVGSQKTTITEIQVIREILFMLSGLESSLFDSQGKPLLDIQLSHASWQIFRSVLISANDARQKISILREYVKQRQVMPLLQVFQAAIENRLGSFDNTIAAMQAQYASISQDFVASIMKLLNDLDPHLRLLRFLAEIIEQLEQPKIAQPFHYLELLFDSAQTLQLEGDEGVYHFISQLFFECFAVYLRPIRNWMQSGELIDGDETFFISRSPLDVPRSRTWVDQFKLKTTPQGSLFAPRFLQPAASKIFTTGKSIVVLKMLGKHWPVQDVAEPATQVDMSAISDLIPFSEVFQNMFNQWMQSKHHAASATLRQTLFQTYNLWSELNMLQHIYLMSDGSRSDQFANAIFKNIDTLSVYWHDRFNLTEIAREAFHGIIDSYRLNVRASWNSAVPDVKNVRRTVRDGLPSIRITYQLPWLSRIVLTDEGLDHYQLVFTFLLQLRRASYVLTRYRIVSGGPAHKTVEQELFFGLRSKLLWFCNTLQSYLSTLVLGPLIGNFLEDMRQAEDIDQMLVTHSSFTKQMVDEACLGGKLDPIRHAILDVFDLAIRLQDALQLQSERIAEDTQLSDMSPPRGDDPKNYVKASEGEEQDEGEGETPLSEQGKSTMMQDAEIPYYQVLREIRADLDRHLKFIAGGLRGVARASGSKAASKWDILAEMFEVGIHGLQQ
ncbi:Spc98 family-domain-containing protein [Nemania abortiva]|nr:Spc98 family-domain-containing protein [Nemania abortiva]